MRGVSGQWSAYSCVSGWAKGAESGLSAAACTRCRLTRPWAAERCESSCKSIAHFDFIQAASGGWGIAQVMSIKPKIELLLVSSSRAPRPGTGAPRTPPVSCGCCWWFRPGACAAQQQSPKAPIPDSPLAAAVPLGWRPTRPHGRCAATAPSNRIHTRSAIGWPRAGRGCLKSRETQREPDHPRAARPDSARWMKCPPPTPSSRVHRERSARMRN